MARLNYQSLSMIALTKGEDACRDALSADGVGNPHVIAQKAAVSLDEMEADREVVAMVNRLAREFSPVGSGTGRGRVSLSPGMVRSYTVQQVKAQDGSFSDVFIRLPVGCLNVSKQEEVVVRVQDDGTLIVSRI